MKLFASKFISNDLFLLFSIFIIYLQSSTKVICAIEISHWMAGSSVKSIRGINFFFKFPWLVYITFQTYCFPFWTPILLSVLSVRPSISLALFSGIAIAFFMIFGTMVDNWNILKAARVFFPRKLIFAQRMSQNAVRQSYCRILYNVISQGRSEWWSTFLACG